MRKMDVTVTVNKPVKEVWDYMDNPDNLPKWIDNFVRYEHVSGERGAEGSKGLHYYLENGREFTMEETVVERRDYEFIKLAMTSKPMDMEVENYFKAVDENTTELRAVAEFTRVGLMMKIMMKLFMPMKKAQATHVKQMEKFKQLVEQS